MKTLTDVHALFKEHFFINDVQQIDLALATYLLGTEKEAVPPVWTFFVDNSGDFKSELLRTMQKLPYVLKVHNLTKNWFSSGNAYGDSLIKRVKAGEPLILLIPDLATLMSKRSDDKNEIWAQFRDIYDGQWEKMTGAKSDDADGATITLMGAATLKFRSQYIINQHLGSRELLFTQFAKTKHKQERKKLIIEKMNKASRNVKLLKKIRPEIQETVKDFIVNRKIKQMTIDDHHNSEINDFLNKQCLRLRLLRADIEKNYYTGEIIGETSIETPTRLKQQFTRLWYGLMSLDAHYPPQRARSIIRRIVDSSANQLRTEIMNVFDNKENKDKSYTINDIEKIVKRGYKTCRTELNVLWALDYIQRESYETVKYGRTVEEYSYFKPVPEIEEPKQDQLPLTSPIKPIPTIEPIFIQEKKSLLDFL